MLKVSLDFKREITETKERTSPAWIGRLFKKLKTKKFEEKVRKKRLGLYRRKKLIRLISGNPTQNLSFV
jgi:hypothetical protein